MLLKTSAKNLNNNVRYIHPVKEIEIGDTDSNFFINEIYQEVVNLNNSTLKKYKKICKVTIATLLSSLTLSTQMAFANSTITVTNSPTIQMPHVVGLDPHQILVWGAWVIFGGIVAGGVIAAICWILTGLMKIIFGKKKKKEAIEWQKDIIRGYSDVLLAPVVIAILTMAALLFFGHFNWYVKPFQGL